MSFDGQQTQYRLIYDEDGVYLEMAPSLQGLSKKDEVGIIEYLKRKNIKEIDSKAVFEAIYADPPRKIRIAPPQKEEPLDEELEIKITDRGMKAYAKLIPPEGGKMLTIDDVYNFLNQQGMFLE